MGGSLCQCVQVPSELMCWYRMFTLGDTLMGRGVASAYFYRWAVLSALDIIACAAQTFVKVECYKHCAVRVEAV